MTTIQNSDALTLRPDSIRLTLRGSASLTRARRPRRPRHDGWTPQRQARFLAALDETGCVTAAASAAGLSQQSAYRFRDRSPPFAGAWDAALARASVNLEAVAYDRVVHGRLRVRTKGGEELWSERLQSDALLLNLLKARVPERYAPGGGAGRGRRLNGASRDPRTGKFVPGPVGDDGLVEVTVRMTPEDAEWHLSDEYARLMDSPEHREWRALTPIERERAIVGQIRERIEIIEAEKAAKAARVEAAQVERTSSGTEQPDACPDA